MRDVKSPSVSRDAGIGLSTAERNDTDSRAVLCGIKRESYFKLVLCRARAKRKATEGGHLLCTAKRRGREGIMRPGWRLMKRTSLRNKVE